MGSYRYRAKKEISGKTIEAVIYAATREDALASVEKMGYILESIEEINMPDRRLYARINLALPIDFNQFKPSNSSDFNEQGITKNVSAGGMLFQTQKPFSVGTIIELILRLPEESENIQCLARVLRVETIEENKEYNIAVCFLELSNTEKRRLNQYLQNKSK